jgi:hypothetical protein
MTNMGALPVSFDIDADNLADAVAKYGEAARAGIERTMKELPGAAPPAVVRTHRAPRGRRSGADREAAWADSAAAAKSRFPSAIVSP